jgi:hypothetical protein
LSQGGPAGGGKKKGERKKECEKEVEDQGHHLLFHRRRRLFFALCFSLHLTVRGLFVVLAWASCVEVRAEGKKERDRA